MTEEESNILIRRRYSAEDESYKYTHIGSGLSVSQAKGKVSRYLGEPDDLLIICDERDIYEFADKAKWVYMADDSGRPRSMPPIHYRLNKYNTWLQAWEGSNSQANEMIHVIYLSMPTIKIVSTLCMISRSVLTYIDPSENRPRSAVETVEAWTKGAATLNDVSKAMDEVESFFIEIYQPGGVSRTQSATSSILSLASIPTKPNVGASTEWAFVNNTVIHAARASLRPDHESLRQLSSIVRSAVPLEEIIKAYES